MKRTFLILLIGLCNVGYGQTFPELEKVLARELTRDSNKDGRWVFYADRANIEKIEKPALKSRIPQYDFYKVTLTNYLGYHVNQGTCVILFDSSDSEIILIEPLWYSDGSEQLIELFIGEEFDNKDDLLTFLTELHELMEIGSAYRFVNTSYSDSLVTYDLVYFTGDSYTTGGDGISSTVTYNKDGIWRQIEIEIEGMELEQYTSINPRLKDKKEFEQDYKRIIK